MRAFAFLSLAAAALAMPVAVPGGSLVNTVAPVVAPVKLVSGVIAHAGAGVDADVANVDANYNSVADNSLNHNNIKVLRDVNVNVDKNPVIVNAKNPKTSVASAVHHSRGAANVYAPVVTILQGIVGLCAHVGVDAKAAIANIGLDYNTILNNSLNGNNATIGKPASANCLVQLLASIIACVRSLIQAGVSVDAIIANVKATAYSLGHNANAGGGAPAPISSHGLTGVVASVVAVVNAIVPIIIRVCADVNLSVLNAALTYNNIANNALNGNSITVL